MKPIFLNETIKGELIKAFTEHLNKVKLSDSTLTYTTQITNQTKEITRAKIIINSTAFLKMMLYIRDTSTEIAWHGTVFKQNENTYYIKDVFLYPQKLAAATVTTDQEKYNNWCVEIEDEYYDNMRLQGHSHVNFGVSPSGTDLSFYNSILQVLSKEDFYIFMIMNKSGDMHFLIYDLKNNVIYEKQDIDIEVKDPNSNENIMHIIDLEKELYCEKPTVPVWNKGTAVSPYTNPYHRQYESNWGTGSTWGTSTGFYEDETETDAIFAELDNKFKNAKLEAPKTKKGKKK